MQAKDVMSAPVISIAAKAKIGEAIETMLKGHISGLPVTDKENRLVGILSEGDLLRRAELGTAKRRPRWIETFLLPGRSAEDYVRAHGRIVEQVMTRDPVSAPDTTPLQEIVSLMERNRIKRIPITRGDKLVGIVTRADLLRAMAGSGAFQQSMLPDDRRIREAIEAEIKAQNWAPASTLRIEVENGMVELGGIILDDRFREAIKVCAQNVPGVKGVHDRLVYVEPYTGAYIDPAEARA